MLKLDKNNIQNIMDLTSLQQSMLFSYNMNPDSRECHEQLILRIAGHVNLDLLEKSWNFAIKQNDVLRSVFRWDGIDKPLQIVNKEYKIKIKYFDYSDIIDQRLAIKELQEDDLKQRFDLSHETIRVYVCKLNVEQVIMMVSNHHIIYDGWSNGILINEVLKAYSEFYHGGSPTFVKKTKFSEFVKYIKNLDKEDQKKYWTNYFGEKFEARCCFDGKRIKENKEITYKLSHDISTSIKNLARENKISLASLFYSSWGILMYKISGYSEVVFGTTVSGRPEEIKSIENMVGLFINIIPLIIKQEGKSVIEIVHDVDKSIRERKNFENTPLIDIKKYLSLKTSEELFNSVVTIENYPLYIDYDNVLSIDDITMIESNNYNLDLQIMTFNDFEFKLKFNNSVVSDEMAEKLVHYIENIVFAVLYHKNATVSEIEMISEEEKKHILYDFNDNYLPIPSDITIPEIFEEQVLNHPDKLAVIYENDSLTYKELNEKANSLARVLRQKGAGPKKVIGLMVDRSVDMAIGVMSIIKSGAAYTPIDPNYPKDRVIYILEDSKADIVITKKCYAETFDIRCHIVDIQNEKVYQGEKSNLDILVKPEDVLYVLYTSGTTGKPKGVMVTQKNLVNMVYSWRVHYRLEEFQVNLLQLASISFDVFSGDLSRSILSGGSMYICPEHTRINMESLYNMINEKEISIFESTPSLIFVLMDYMTDNNLFFNNLKLMILGSDNCPIQEYKKILEKCGGKIRVINSYGVTETTIDSSYYEEKLENIPENLINTPIGKPMHNTKFYVLGDGFTVLPVGVIGELYIGGAGVTMGYNNKPDLTEEKFFYDPFVSESRLYKTGDLARWLSDGNLEFLGRIDNQVKIRGFRIELGEIENKLLQLESIKEAVVVVKELGTQSYICAYVSGNYDINQLDLYSYLTDCLPKYMIPSHIVKIDKMPLTPNGKVDRKALPEPNFEETLLEYVAPRNTAEEKLVKIWQEVLGVERIGINDNFFELGGHSLKVTVLIHKIKKTMNKDIPIHEIFARPTIAEQSDYLLSEKESIYKKIDRVAKKEYYEASSAQKRMYMLQKIDPNSIAYNISGKLEIIGEINVDKLNIAFQKLISRHEILRTSFTTIEGKIVQKVHDISEIDIYIERVKVFNENKLEEFLLKFIRPFDLEKPSLIRACLLEIEKFRKIMLFDMHHIISDGVSMSIIANEICEHYVGHELEELPIQYKDFSAWQLGQKHTDEYKKNKEYWLKEFKDELPILNFPTDYLRKNYQDFVGDSVKFTLDKKMTSMLNETAKKTGATLHMILLSCLNVLIARYSGQNDFVVGTPVAGRIHKELEANIGMFVNTIAVRTNITGNETFCEYINNVKNKILIDYENQGYQFDELVGEVVKEKNLNRNPLFDIMFVLQNMEEAKFEIDNTIFKVQSLNNSTEKFDITMTAIEEHDQISIVISYAVSLYKRSTIVRMAEHYTNIVSHVGQKQDIKIKDIDFLTDSERTMLLYDFNNTVAEYPNDKLIHQLFEERVEIVPDNIAVYFEGNYMTYSELNQKSNALARTLRNNGVKVDDIVGIMINRSLEMIIGMLSIIKAGGAYLPIDPDYPKGRIEYTLMDSGAAILVSTKDIMDKLDINIIFVDILNSESYNVNCSNLVNINTPDNLAYVIYTSGTTGKPKGVMIEHRNVVRLMFNEKIQYDFNDCDVWTMFHSFCFDFSVWEMYGALLYGGKLIIVSKEQSMDVNSFLMLLKKERVTVLNQIPTPFYSLMYKELEFDDTELNLRYVIFGGEALKPELLKSWYMKYPNTRLINMYGITETTVHVTFKEIGNREINDRISNVGKPVPTLTVYIMNEDSKLLPIGVPGELCVGGDGVARGYLYREELTAERFIINPYKKGERIYKSGDKARMLESGDIEYLGRIDFQVKIRGFRIELGEIESAMLKFDGIKEVVALVKGENENKCICSYYVGDNTNNIGELRTYLNKLLPEYMIPSYFVALDSMPLTYNGKIDRKALPDINGNIETGVEYEAPTNKTEEKLVEIWKEVLGVKHVGISDNFFELGGHSLKATALVAKIQKEMLKNILLRDVFMLPTIRELSTLLDSKRESSFDSIHKVHELVDFEISSAQKRIYMLQQFDKESTAYNMPSVFVINNDFDPIKITETFKKLMRRHETLRTYFVMSEHEINQRIDNICDINLEMTKGHENINNVISNFIRPFDLSKAPLFRVRLHEDRNNVYLMIDMHHIISDGVSMNLLIRDFIDTYNGKELESLKFQYKDVSNWQNKFLMSEEGEKQKKFWVDQFQDDIPVLEIHTDFSRPSIKSFEGDEVTFELESTIFNSLKELAKETGTTLHMVLLSGLYILVSKYSRQEDIVIGVPIAGRQNADLQNIIGCFTNMLALRNKPESQKKYIDFLQELKENSICAYDNQEYQFEELIDVLNVRRNASRNPIFDIMFSMFELEEENIEDMSRMKITSYPVKKCISKLDLSMNIFQRGNSLSVSIEFCTKLFYKETIKQFGRHFNNILNNIVDNKEMKLSDIELLSEEERNHILFDFNETQMAYPSEKTIIQLFEEQVENSPTNVAVVFENIKLTYRELNRKANNVAMHLRNLGVAGESIVAIMIDRSIELIVGIFGILKAGAAYLPIDPIYPADRIDYMIRESGSKIFLTESKFKNGIVFNGLVLDIYDIIKNDSVFENPTLISGPKNLAYLIYTSGSTGNPKGVMIENQQVCNFIYAMIKDTGMNQYKTVLCITTVCFDIFALETLLPLTSGLTVVIADRETSIDSDALGLLISENNIDVIQCTPSRLNILLDNMSFQKNIWNIKAIFVGGEEISSSIYEKWNKNPNTKVFNVYGPTETTIWSSIQKMEDENHINIGHPIGNTQIYIMNDNHIVPIGAEGELCIGGDGVSRGYLHKPELTAEKFIDNPFIKGKKIYKTGDLASWLPDGAIQFHGRIDNQVKIRGYRIELGEIENKILGHAEIREVAVMVHENELNDKYICAYIISEKDVLDLDLAVYLKRYLPNYMIPAYYVQMDKIPVTPNGKINRSVLPKPDFKCKDHNYEEPHNLLEIKLVKIWREVLNVHKIGINDNFFERGGHSLRATVLVSKISKELHKEITINSIFQMPTIKELADFLRNEKDNNFVSIQVVSEQRGYEVSSAQKRMYILQQIDPDSIAYNMPSIFVLDGTIDIKKIEDTLKKIIIRHESFRTYFESEDELIIQKIAKQCDFELNVKKVDFSLEMIWSNFLKPFDFSKAPLLRAEIVKCSDNTYLLFDMPHIISDGVSTSILVKDFIDIYRGKELPTLKLQYKDFAEWQNSLLKSEEIKKQEEYWLKQFDDEVPVLKLPMDFDRPIIQSYEGDNYQLVIDLDMTQRLRKISKSTGTTMQMMILAALNILFSKCSGQEDIVIGVPVAGRQHADLQSIIGMFVNSLALRNLPEGNKTFGEFLEEVKGNSLAAYENQTYQFEELVDKLGIIRDTSRNPLFDVMLNMVEKNVSKEVDLDGLLLKPYNYDNKIAKCDIAIEAYDNINNIEININYCTKLFKKLTIIRMGQHLYQLLNEITIKGLEYKICDLDIMSTKEKNQLIYDFNNTKSFFPSNITIESFFEECTEKNPNNIAIIAEERTFTYRELNSMANQLARLLRNKGVKEDSIVSIMVDRSPEMIIGILSILKAGGAYLPIDPNYPNKRIEYMLKDSHSNWILCKGSIKESISYTGELIDIFSEGTYIGDDSNPDKIQGPNSLAYIIYTSGTTGKPKGVMIEHRSIVNRINWMQKQYPICSKDTILQKTTFTFDVSVWEILWWSLCGASVKILIPDGEKDPSTIVRAIKESSVTVVHFVPSMLNIFIDYVLSEKLTDDISSLEKIFTSGEALNSEQANLFNEKIGFINNTNLINLYGPTEAAIDVTYYECDGQEKIIPIGKPIDNIKIFIVDNYMKLVPLGAIGELCISGVGVGRGYLNEERLTNEKFTENPYDDSCRLYHTGDLARWMADGNIEYIGRKDNQVKIRGFRIELGEIESRILQHRDIKEAAVITKENDKHEKYICAYVISGQNVKSLNLREFLKKTLPEYMIPAFFVKLEKMPLSSNGKLNRKMLLEPNSSETLKEYDAPRNNLEKNIVQIWSEVLGIKKIGISDNFFELGGHSLNAAVMLSKLHKALNKKVTLKELFGIPTIKELGYLISNQKENRYENIQIAEQKDRYSASSAQKRMFMLQQFEKDSTAYNMPTLFEISDKPDFAKIELVVKQLLERHETLRTYFVFEDDDIYQKISNRVDFKLEVRRENTNMEGLKDCLIKPFDLNITPMINVEIVQNKGKEYLFIDMHHIISDDISNKILINEFIALYNDKELPKLRLQYKDYAEWQNNFNNTEEFMNQKNYWLNRFINKVPVLELPVDFERTEKTIDEGDIVIAPVNYELTERLISLTFETGTTMHMLLLSSFYILLAKYTGQDDIVVGVPVHGRQNIDLQKIIGVFINTLALRNTPKTCKKFIDFLLEVRINSMNAYENQEYQFDELVMELGISKEDNSNPLFDVMFDLTQALADNELNMNDMKLKTISLENKISKFDLNMDIIDYGNSLDVTMSFSKGIYCKQTVNYIVEDYISILETIVEDKEILLGEIKLKNQTNYVDSNLDDFGVFSF